MNSVSMISVQFKSNVDISTAMRDLKDKVDLAKTDLPSDVKDSLVKEISFDDSPIWTFSIS
jgi:multidrug efflux pump